jgi:phage-related holin
MLERNIHRYLNVKNKFLTVKHSHSEESFLLTNDEIKDLIILIQNNQFTRFTEREIVNKQNMKDQVIFPYIEYKLGIDLFENLAQGGTRVKAMTKNLKNTLDKNAKDQKLVQTSVKKTKKKNIKLPKKGIRIASFDDEKKI